MASSPGPAAALHPPPGAQRGGGLPALCPPAAPRTPARGWVRATRVRGPLSPSVPPPALPARCRGLAMGVLWARGSLPGGGSGGWSRGSGAGGRPWGMLRSGALGGYWGALGPEAEGEAGSVGTIRIGKRWSSAPALPPFICSCSHRGLAELRLNTGVFYPSVCLASRWARARVWVPRWPVARGAALAPSLFSVEARLVLLPFGGVTSQLGSWRRFLVKHLFLQGPGAAVTTSGATWPLGAGMAHPTLSCLGNAGTVVVVWGSGSAPAWVLLSLVPQVAFPWAGNLPGSGDPSVAGRVLVPWYRSLLAKAGQSLRCSVDTGLGTGSGKSLPTSRSRSLFQAWTGTGEESQLLRAEHM